MNKSFNITTTFSLFENYGAYYAIQDGMLLEIPSQSGVYLLDAEGIEPTEITAPQDQAFLDEINNFFNVNLTMNDFAGR